MNKKPLSITLSLVVTGIAVVFATWGGIRAKKYDDTIESSLATQHADNFEEYDWKNYSGTYYSSITDGLTEGLDGTLRTKLTSLIFPSSWYTYGGSGTDTLSEILQSADEDPTNSSNMVYLYTRDSVKKNAASSWNREHTWPKNLSNSCWEEKNAGADLLHIRPTYLTTNSTRSNSKFAELNPGTKKTYNGMDYAYISGSSFEPLEAVKGDVARIVMYVWVAYKEYYGTKMPAITNVFESYDTLLTWHTQDKPDMMEANRNNVSLSSKQKNRNPFVDHPEYAWKIFGDSCSSSVKEACKTAYPEGGAVAPTSLTASPSSVNLVKGGTQKITVTANSGASNSVTWSTSNSSVATVTSGLITATGKGSCTITATSKLDTNVKATVSVTVKEYTALSITGTPTKTSYYDGDTFDPTGLTVKGTYSGGQDTIDNSSCSWTPDPLTVGTTAVTCTFGGLTAKYTGITVEIKPVSTEIEILGSHESLSTTEGNQTLVVGGATFKGHMKKRDAGSEKYLWFTAGSGYIYNSSSLGEIESISLYYASGGSNVAYQAINLGTSMLSSFDSSGKNGTIISTSTGGKSNSFSPKSSYGFFNISVTNKNLQLTKLVITLKTSSAEEEASAWGETFLSEVTCDGGITAPSTTKWNSCSTSYSSLSSDAKKYYTGASSSADSNIVGAITRYDFILGKYGSITYSDFMNRGVSARIVNERGEALSSTSSIVIIVIGAVSSLSLIACIYLKKKKQVGCK